MKYLFRLEIVFYYFFIFIDISNGVRRHHLKIVPKTTAVAKITTTTTTKSNNLYHAQNHIVNPHNFSFIQNPGYSVCNNSDTKSPVYILVYVHSGPSNYQRRIVIRETWATQTLFPYIRLVFMMGKTMNEHIMKAIEYENTIYHDIVQEDFIDSYKNLTYKGIMALKWISIYCQQTKYILKVDDDIVVNTFTLVNHLKFLDQHKLNQQNTILCLLWSAMTVMRDRLDKKT